MHAMTMNPGLGLVQSIGNALSTVDVFSLETDDVGWMHCYELHHWQSFTNLTMTSSIHLQKKKADTKLRHQGPVVLIKT